MWTSGLIPTGEQMRAARALARLDQKALAQLASVSVETIKRIEAIRGPINANAHTLKRLVDALATRNVVFTRTAAGLSVGTNARVPNLEAPSAAPSPPPRPERRERAPGFGIGAGPDWASVAQSAPILMGYWDLELRCRLANQRYEDWFGISPADAIGGHVGEVIGPALYDMNRPHIEAALKGMPQAFTRSFAKPDGALLHAWIQYAPDVDANGRVRGFTTLMTDISAITLFRPRATS